MANDVERTTSEIPGRHSAPLCGECNKPILPDMTCGEGCERGRSRPKLAKLVEEVEALRE